MKSEVVSLGRALRRLISCLLSICVYSVLFCASVCGLDRDRTIIQFHHTAWTAKEGAPEQIRAIAQTNDGYLWLGTASGLYRFDGVQFDQYMPRSGGDFPSNNICSLLATPDGGLWIGYWFGGASFLRNGDLINYGEPEGLPSGIIWEFGQDDEGTIWVAAGGGLARLEGSRWQRTGIEWNYLWKGAQTVFVDKAGTLWVAAEGTIAFLPKGQQSFQPTGEKIGQVLDLGQSPDGALWIAETTLAVRQLRMPGTEPYSLGPQIQLGSADMLFDREGALWVSSIGDGIRRIPYTDRFRGQTIAQFSTDAEIFTEENGLSANYVWTVFEDRENSVWIGTAKGLDRFRASDLVPVRFPPGYQNFGLAAGDGGEIWIGSANRILNRIRGSTPTPVSPRTTVNFLFRDEEGAIWASGRSEIYRWKGEKFTKFAMPYGAQILMDTTELVKDRAGVLWAYTAQEGLCQLKDGVWSHYDRQAELPKASAIAGAIDSSDRKWFGYPANKLTMIDGTDLRTFSRDDGLEVGDVKVIQERNGHTWVGGSLGVAVYEADRFRMLAVEGAEGLSGVSGVIAPTDGSLWLNASRGVIHIPADEVRLTLEDPAHKMRYRVFDFLDGLPGSAQQTAPYPTAVEGSDGRLWFSTDKGVAWIDPQRIPRNAAPPPVSVRSLTTDEKSFDPLQSLELPEGTTTLQIAYTALSLSIPERIHFKYKLDGVDAGWQEAGTRRQAFYNSLAPGRYQFHVIASNQDGVWNETGATLSFTIKPMFYQTLWFRSLMVFVALLLIASLLYVFYRWRLARATDRLNLAFEGRLAERTRIAHELHDTLLQGFFGATMRLQAISNLLPAKSGEVKENLDEVLDQIDVVLEEGRRAIWDMHALSIGENDLGEAFRLAGEDLSKTYPTNFSVTIEGESRPLNPLIRDQIYRIGREALINAFRHAKASKIELSIEYAARYLRIVIRDNGAGISSDYLSAGRAGHLGLSNMREYAKTIGAELEISSRVESGTEVELIVPHLIAFVNTSSVTSLKR